MQAVEAGAEAAAASVARRVTERVRQDLEAGDGTLRRLRSGNRCCMVLCSVAFPSYTPLHSEKKPTAVRIRSFYFVLVLCQTYAWNAAWTYLQAEMETLRHRFLQVEELVLALERSLS